MYLVLACRFKMILTLRPYFRKGKNGLSVGAISRLLEGGAGLFGNRAAVMALQEGEERVLKNYQLNFMKLDADTRSFVEKELIPPQQLTSQSLEALKSSMR